MIIEKENYYYDGETLDGVPHGKGLLKTDISSYFGNFSYGHKEGKGREVFKDGTEFKGNFWNDQFYDENGEKVCPDGTIITGKFINYIPHGHVNVEAKDYEYVGYMKNGLKEGKGIKTISPIGEERGNFICDYISYGKKWYGGSQRYEGCFIKGIPNGNEWSVINCEGYRFVGFVVNGKKIIDKRLCDSVHMVKFDNYDAKDDPFA